MKTIIKYIKSLFAGRYIDIQQINKARKMGITPLF